MPGRGGGDGSKGFIEAWSFFGSFTAVVLSVAAGWDESSLSERCRFVSCQRVLQLCHSKPTAGWPGRAPLCAPHLVPPGGEEGWVGRGGFRSFPPSKTGS